MMEVKNNVTIDHCWKGLHVWDAAFIEGWIMRSTNAEIYEAALNTGDDTPMLTC